jgi:hypothetical protein
MLFSADSWPRIADGTITVTFRTWSRAQARTGGRYRVGGMLIEADDVRTVTVADITDADAIRSGHHDRTELLARLGAPDPSSTVWRVEFHYIGDDDRTVRGRDDELSTDELDDLIARLDRLDRRAGGPPWTRATLRLIDTYPGVVSTALARQVGYERPVFKLKVRQLKELGLTESLEVGYRLSPRGQAVLRAIG